MQHSAAPCSKGACILTRVCLAERIVETGKGLRSVCLPVLTRMSSSFMVATHTNTQLSNMLRAAGITTRLATQLGAGSGKPLSRASFEHLLSRLSRPRFCGCELGAKRDGWPAASSLRQITPTTPCVGLNTLLGMGLVGRCWVGEEAWRLVLASCLGAHPPPTPPFPPMGIGPGQAHIICLKIQSLPFDRALDVGVSPGVGFAFGWPPRSGAKKKGTGLERTERWRSPNPGISRLCAVPHSGAPPTVQP